MRNKLNAVSWSYRRFARVQISCMQRLLNNAHTHSQIVRMNVFLLQNGRGEGELGAPPSHRRHKPNAIALKTRDDTATPKTYFNFLMPYSRVWVQYRCICDQIK